MPKSEVPFSPDTNTVFESGKAKVSIFFSSRGCECKWLRDDGARFRACLCFGVGRKWSCVVLMILLRSPIERVYKEDNDTEDENGIQSVLPPVHYHNYYDNPSLESLLR